MITEIAGTGGDGPPVVYVPGIDGTGKFLLGTAARLEESFFLVRTRYRLGDARDHTYETLARTLVEGVAGLGIDRFSIVTESFGGAVSLRAALDFPDRISSLLVVNSFPRFRKRTSLALSRVFAGLVPGPLFEAGRWLFAPTVLFAGRRERDAIRQFRETATGFFDQSYRARLAMVARVDLRDELPRVEQPVSLFASTLDFVVDSVPQARIMEKLLPRVRLEIVRRGGHLILPLRQLDWVSHVRRIVDEGAASV